MGKILSFFKKILFPLICVIIILSLFLFWWIPKFERSVSVHAVLPLSGEVIVIDPGHGGYDPGVMFDEEILEKDIVLEIGFYLREFLQQGGAEVVMTRDDDADFLQTSVGPKKRMDMQNRLEFINEIDPDFVVSIHTNYIPSPIWRGAQTFYHKDCEESKFLADSIQKELIRVLENTERAAKFADYYLLVESPVPASLVEAGFLSNPEEAELLTTPEYQKKIAWAIYLGIINYHDC